MANYCDTLLKEFAIARENIDRAGIELSRVRHSLAQWTGCVRHEKETRSTSSRETRTTQAQSSKSPPSKNGESLGDFSGPIPMSEQAIPTILGKGTRTTQTTQSNTIHSPKKTKPSTAKMDSTSTEKTEDPHLWCNHTGNIDEDGYCVQCGEPLYYVFK